MGAKVLNIVVENSGLPEDYAKNRLEELLHNAGFDPDKAGLEEIRVVLANLLQDLILESEHIDKGSC
jgi:hypothetical protein